MKRLIELFRSWTQPQHNGFTTGYEFSEMFVYGRVC